MSYEYTFRQGLGICKNRTFDGVPGVYLWFTVLFNVSWFTQPKSKNGFFKYRC